jgi:DNA transposition AAA+ family ATPase
MENSIKKQKITVRAGLVPAQTTVSPVQTEKQRIREEIIALSEQSSQEKVAHRAGVSTATISQIVNNNHKLIAVEMWRKIAIALHIDGKWQHAETVNNRILSDLLTAAQSKSLAISISHEAGAGKSHAYKRYMKSNKQVIYVECKNYWSKKSFIKALLSASGLKSVGTTEEMIEKFISHVQTLENPLVIFDQTDKLKDAQMDLFMDLYNDLPHCGFVLSGVPALKKRILRGVQCDKIGYRELYSRIGRKFIHLDPISPADVKNVCTANGLEDELKINEIYNTCDGDFRRVRRSVEQYFLIQHKKSA